MPATELLQSQLTLILDNVLGAAAFPDDWLEAGGFEYLYRTGSMLVRHSDVERVSTEMRSRNDNLPEPELIEVVPGQLTRYQYLAPDAEVVTRTAPDMVREMNDAVGRRVAFVDHLFYTCSQGHCCAGTEPESLPPGTQLPSPLPQLGEYARHPAAGKGAGVNVRIYDTGLVPDAAQDHWWLSGVTGDAERVTGAPNPGTILADGGHGTFVAGCLRTSAPEAGVVVAATAPVVSRLTAKVPPPLGVGFESDLVNRISQDLLTALGSSGAVPVPDIILISYSGWTADGRPPFGFVTLFDNLLSHLKDVLVVAPAGNASSSVRYWPAALPGVVSVGALAANWRDRAAFSNYGPTVDLYMPGEQIVNAFGTGAYTCHWPENQGQVRTFTGMARWSGTSFAAPLFAGEVAALMSGTGLNSRQAAAVLLDLACRNAVPGVGPILLPGSDPGR